MKNRLVSLFRSRFRFGQGLQPDAAPSPLPEENIYWEKRVELFYYEVVKEWIQKQGEGGWILDVGARSTPIVLEGTFSRRTAIDIIPFRHVLEGVEQIETNWMEFPLQGQADLVLCLQVLEHLDDELVAPFAQKVLKAGKRAIISVPYKWSEKDCEHHLQDPVDLDKLIGWTGRPPLEHYVERRDKMNRLIALFEGG
jgi:hypothetical protein